MDDIKRWIYTTGDFKLINVNVNKRINDFDRTKSGKTRTLWITYGSVCEIACV